MLNGMGSSFTYGIQLSDGSNSKTWDQVQAEGRVMRWLRTGHGCLCLVENHQSARSRMNLHLFMFWTQVRTSCHFIWIASKFGNAEHIKYPKADANPTKPGEKSQLLRKSSAGPTAQEQPARPSSATGKAVHTVQQLANPEELRRAVSPPNTRALRPNPNGLLSHPANLNGKTRRAIGGDSDVESSTESVIRERALSPDQVRAPSPPARGVTPTGPSRVLGQPIEQTRSPNNTEERIETWKETDISDHHIEQAYARSTYSFSILASEPCRESDVWTIEVPGDCAINSVEVQSGVQSHTDSLPGRVPHDLSDLYNGAGSRSGRKRSEKSLKKEASDKRNENYLEDSRSYS